MKLWLLALALASSTPSYEGTWKIETAVVAPWWAGREAPRSGFVKELVGRTFTIANRRIVGPGIVGCASERFAIKEVPAQGLFQGMLGEDAARATRSAAGLGFRAGPWKTVDGGCELEFHFADSGSGAFGLDNHVFRFRRVK